MEGLNVDFKKLDLTEEEFTAELSASSKFLGVGIHDVRIVSAVFKKMNDNDPTWANYQIMFSKTGVKTQLVNGKTKAIDENGREVPALHKFLMIPTQRVKYEKFGISRSGALFPFQNFRAFCGGLGEKAECTSESLTHIFNTWFKDPSELIGQEMSIEVGYTKVHCKMVEGVFNVVDVKGEKVLADDYPTRDDAKAAAAEAGLAALQEWPEITKIFPRK